MWIVPTVIEREGAHERVYDLYSCLLKERIVLLSGEIDDQLSSSICAQLLYLSGLSSEAIILYINSAGGSVSAGLAIYDIMQYIPNEIITIDTVSYTHLDVYKRQPFAQSKKQRKCSGKENNRTAVRNQILHLRPTDSVHLCPKSGNTKPFHFIHSLFRFLVNRMLSAFFTILFQLQTLRIGLLISMCRIVTRKAARACQNYFFTHVYTSFYAY